MLDRDLRVLFTDPFGSVEVSVETGSREGQTIRGFFDARYSEALLGGQRDLMNTGGSRFFCLSSEAEGLDVDDRIKFKGELYKIDSILDDKHGVVQLTFEAKL